MVYCRIYTWIIAVTSLNIVLATPVGSPGSDETPGFCKPIIIAHRGASDFVPEHTLAAYSLAIEMGADFVEPDIVITKDKHLIALHDNQLGVSTDIADHSEFAGRKTTKTINREIIDGWFAEDFTLAEIKKLRVLEPKPDAKPCNTRMNGDFEIPTLEEIINLVKSYQRDIIKRIIGIFPEIKYGSYFRNLSLPIEKNLVDILHKNGFKSKKSPVYIQSAEITTLKELRKLTTLKLLLLYYEDMSIQPEDQYVLGTNLTYGDLSTKEGFKTVATFADAVGPSKNTIDDSIASHPTNFLKLAQTAGLEVIPYTFSMNNETIESAIPEFKKFFAMGVDGIFADYPNVPVKIRGFCNKRNLKGASSKLQINFKLICTIFTIFIHTILK